MKRSTRVRDRVQRISYLHKDGKWREPANKFETYRYITLDGKRKRDPQCFKTIEEAVKFRDSTEEVNTSKGKTLGEAVEEWKPLHFANIQPQTRENFLKVFPDLEDRRKREEYARTKRRPVKELPCDFLLPIPMKELGGQNGPLIIDQWLAHVKHPEFIATLKPTRLSFAHEHEVLNIFFTHYETRVEREGWRSPFLKDHLRKLKFRDPKPKAEKDLPALDFWGWLDRLIEVTNGTEYEYVLPKMAEFQYLAKTRVSEAAAVHVEDADPISHVVTLSRRIIYLRRGKQKAVPLDGHKENGGFRIPSAQLVNLCLGVAKHRSIIRGPLFYVGGNPMPYRQIQKFYDKAHRLAGTGQSATHVLRHGAASEFDVLTGDRRVTQKALNHADPNSTSVYAKVREGTLREAQEKFEEKVMSMRGVR